MNKKIDELLNRDEAYLAGTLALIVAGLKPGGECSLGHQIDDYNTVMKYCIGKGLKTHINYEDISQKFVSKEALQVAFEHASSIGLNCKKEKKELREPTLYIYNLPYQMLFWRNELDVDHEKITEAYREGDHETFGRFAGYPECCIRTYRGKESVERYHDELRKKVSTEGVESVLHLVGIRHIPHSVDCRKTRELGYAQYLKEYAMLLHATEMCSLLGRLTGRLV